MQLPCLPEIYLKPSNLDTSVLWTCSVGSYGVRITRVNSNFGRCGLLHCLMMALCQFILLKSRGSSREDFFFCHKGSAYRSKCKREVLTGEWNLKAQGNYNCQIQIQPIFLPIFLGHFEAILLISAKFSSYVYAIESVSLWMGRAVKIGSQNQVMYIYHRVGWSKL